MATSHTELLTRFSFPKVPGDQPWSIIDVRGPHHYEPVIPAGTVEEPPRGGQRITAQDFGLQAIDFAVAMAANDGEHSVMIIPVGGTLHFKRKFIGGDMESIILQWLDTAGAEEGDGDDLSIYMVRVLALGR